MTKKGGMGFSKDSTIQITDSKYDTLFKDCAIPDLVFILFPFLRFFGHKGSKCILGSGTSIDTIIHLYQNVFARRQLDFIVKYNMGKAKNLQKYGTEEPPKYNEKLIRIKMDLIVADHDKFCTEEAARAFTEKVNKFSSERGGEHLVNVHVMENWHHFSIGALKDPKKFYNVLDKILF